MAFHQPTPLTLQRNVRPPVEERESPSPQSHDNQDALDQSQTSWVLFSPVTEDHSDSEASEAAPSLKTPGRSRLGDIGSTHGPARSDHLGDGSLSIITSVAGDEVGDDDGELDSLDSHLPSFRSLPRRYSQQSQGGNNQQSFPVLPAHDGLGSFHLPHPASGIEAQEQIYQFERFNPRKVRRRRESLDRMQTEWENEHTRDAQKRQWIESWRMEHSRVLLDEIQRETRRRRRSVESMYNVPTVHTVYGEDKQANDPDMDNMTWHDEDADVAMDDDESGSFLARFAQKVIKDILGIDDRLLSILVGETIPEDDEELSSTPRASHMGGRASEAEDSWQTQMLETVSRELGILVNQLSHHHPGAFSTYSAVQQMPLPYAGLPVIPESSTTAGGGGGGGDAQSSRQSEQPRMPEFQPTINKPSRPVSIPSRQSEKASATAAANEDAAMGMSNAFTKDEWERELDVNLVFRYIRSRFSSRWSTPSQAGTGSLAASNTQETAAKAARVRQHHPLISRSRTADRRSFRATTPSSPVTLRHQSSCASQSTRRSARRSSCSSRHYWDIGGSLGTGSVIASNGPMGSWGEV